MNVYSESSIQELKKQSTEQHMYAVTITDNRSEADKANDLFIDISDLDGTTDMQFEKQFLRYCDYIAERYAKIIYIPVNVWLEDYGEKCVNIDDPRNHTAIGNLVRMMRDKVGLMKSRLAGFSIVFGGSADWFAVNVDELKKSDYNVIKQNLALFGKQHSIRGATGKQNVTSKPATVRQEKDIEAEAEEQLKQDRKDELVHHIQQAATNSTSEEEAIELINNDEYVKKLLQDIEDDEYGAPKFSNARTAHMTATQRQFLASTVHGKSVKEMIENPSKEELPETVIPVHSINDEWEHMKFVNFGKEYDIDADIVRMLDAFSDKDYPITVRDIQVEDNSTSMDYINTYYVDMEDGNGKRFKLVFDVPKFRNNRFLKLRGNDKVISGQLLNLPCIKTDDETVKMVSNYSMVFLRRYGVAGKSYPNSDRLIRALKKYEGKDIEVTFGDNSRISAKYDLPMDYLDLTYFINTIKTNRLTMFFNQDEYQAYGVDYSKGIPYAIDNKTKSILYYRPEYEDSLTSLIFMELSFSSKFVEIYESIKPASKYMYSQAYIMANKIPLIVVLGISMKLTDILRKAKVDYMIHDKRPKIDYNIQDMIRFSDCYLVYKLTHESSLLMNGLKACNTEAYTLNDMEKKRTWLDFLDDFGGRIIADGLENFSQLFLDPITAEICRDMKIPDNYYDLLIYANNLLADTKYNKHADITGNRYRTNEIIAGHCYRVLSKAYGVYRTNAKRGKAATMSIKRSAVIDDILTNNPVTSDLSMMSPLLELEAGNSATFKGLSGLNTERAYGLDKRMYDKTMVNKLALSTGFAGNVGVNRQTTMDMDIQGTRGYIKDSDPEEISVTKRLSAVEAVTPFGTTRVTVTVVPASRAIC